MLWAFIPGLILAAFETGGGPEWLRRRRMHQLPLLLLAASAAATAAYIVAFGGIPSIDRRIGASVLVSLATGAFVAAALVQQWSGRPTWRFLDNRPLQWIGARSYSVYLLHYTVIVQLAPHLIDLARGGGRKSFLLLLGLSLVVSLAVADLSYRFVEQPFMRLRAAPPGRRLVSGESRSARASSASENEVPGIGSRIK
jgi:peptidoglycan/LPS O-acetylase OafA/YrhL